MLQYQHNESKSKLSSLALGQSGDVIRKMQGPIHDPSVKHTVLCCSKFVNVQGDIFVEDLLQDLFPTCQVRVVRFYQSCSPLPRLAVLLLLLLFLAFSSSSASSSSFSSAMSASTSTSTSALPTLRQALCQLSSPSSWDLPSSVRTAGPQPGTFPAQCALLDLNLGPSQLSVHRWTSTWDLPSSVCTAGPQPGTFPAQCAPLDLNLRPSQLSVHRWTSTWDLPSSGPQPGTSPAQCAPLDLNGQIECQKICQIECQIECQKICQIEC